MSEGYDLSNLLEGDVDRIAYPGGRYSYRFHVECGSGRHFGNGNTENAARRRCNDFCECKGEKVVIDYTRADA